ncbi:Ca2+-binding RTX toxin-like protein [Sinorhizobium medicae]
MAVIVGSTGYDILQGTDEADHIWGLHGGDTIDAGGGDDFVDGGDLSDVLTSSSGYDRLHGGAGDDQIVLTGTGGAVTGGLGFDRLTVDMSMLSDQLVFNGASGHGIIGYGAPGNGTSFSMTSNGSASFQEAATIASWGRRVTTGSRPEPA